MRPIKISQTGVGTESARVDYRQNSFKIGVGCKVTGTATYTLKYTFDDPSEFTDSTAISIYKLAV